MNIKKIISVLCVPLFLIACESKQDTGTVLGAIVGAVIGNAIGGEGTGEVVAIAVGTLAGAYIGSEIGKSLDRADQAAMERTTQQSLEHSPSNTTASWVNPDSGHSGTVTPTATFQNEDGQYCREYQQTVTIAGKSEEAYGTACRQPDGSWKIVNNRK